MRIICSHEHLVPLSLPPAPRSRPPSPLSSRVSASSCAAPALSAAFRAAHYLPAALLSDVAAALDLPSPVLQNAAVSSILALLTSHDGDPRLLSAENRARVAALYMPLLSVAMDACPLLSRPGNASSGQWRFTLTYSKL
ncbi:hypothetical protein JYU34_002914 [Plutella xylostella]|uniref:Uncharacterized protein n=1 Tax=Plutella xylostella TaxID=51655 RepID=A0ABQ7R3G9_PLUXY|nr:hypothetical protein JYU34_002914 [Plutella xylostella]